MNGISNRIVIWNRNEGFICLECESHLEAGANKYKDTIHISFMDFDGHNFSKRSETKVSLKAPYQQTFHSEEDVVSFLMSLQHIAVEGYTILYPEKAVTFSICHYVLGITEASRTLHFQVYRSCIREYLDETESPESVEEVCACCDDPESLYEYAKNMNLLVNQDIVYCKDFDEKYNAYIECQTSKSSVNFMNKEQYYWSVYDAMEDHAPKCSNEFGYDVANELEHIQSSMHNTNFEQDSIILSDAADLIRGSEKYRTGMEVIYEGMDESDDILCPNCKASVARMDDYEEMRPAHCPECGTKLIYHTTKN